MNVESAIITPIPPRTAHTAAHSTPAGAPLPENQGVGEVERVAEARGQLGAERVDIKLTILAPTIGVREF